jgi:hypothetical protein
MQQPLAVREAVINCFDATLPFWIDGVGAIERRGRGRGDGEAGG